MIGAHERNARVRIEFDSQCELLLGPTGGKWMPCNYCGAVEEMPLDVVSYHCDACQAHLDDCDEVECCHAVHTREYGRINSPLVIECCGQLETLS